MWKPAKTARLHEVFIIHLKDGSRDHAHKVRSNDNEYEWHGDKSHIVYLDEEVTHFMPQPDDPEVIVT